MGFKLGSFLGKVAGAAVRIGTGGAVRPTFSRPRAPSGVPVDSIRTTARTRGFAGLTGTEFTETIYTTPVSQGGGGTSLAPMGGGCPTGFRLNKSTYVTRGGGTSRWPAGLQVHQAGTECVRRRKINAGNGKAATRAVRRLVAFYRLSNRVAKQLQRAARGAKIGRGRGMRRLPPGRAGTSIVQVSDD